MHAQLVAAGITTQNTMNSGTVACCGVQVKPGHVGVSDVKVDATMKKAAESVTFWVSTQEWGIWHGREQCTFWSMKEKLQASNIVISVPAKRCVVMS